MDSYCWTGNTVIRFIFIVKKILKTYVKIFYTNMILQREFLPIGWLPVKHKHSPIAAAHVSLYTW